MLGVITVATHTGTEEAVAFVFGNWAAHPTIPPASDALASGWRITHIPSGMCAPVELTERVARAAAEILSETYRLKRTPTLRDSGLVLSAIECAEEQTQ